MLAALRGRGKSMWYGAATAFIATLHNVFLLYHINMFTSVFHISPAAL